MTLFDRMTSYIAPAIFVNHGGGPMPLLNDKSSARLTYFLKDDIQKHVNLKALKAIILVTAHWEEDQVTISSGENHDLYFDYYGFPPESYKLRYDAPGDPKLAGRIHDALKKEGVDCKLDPQRGWDHGVFVPMTLINPSADIPIVQVSVIRNQNPAEHYKLGQVLHQFRKEGIAVFGSGMSYHNMHYFRSVKIDHDSVLNESFDNFLNDTCTAKDEKKRYEGMLSWSEQSGALDAHPPNAAEHFMPLIVVAGAGGNSSGERICNWDYKKVFRLSDFAFKGE